MHRCKKGPHLLFLFWVCVLSKYLDITKIRRCLWDPRTYPEKNSLGRPFNKSISLSRKMASLITICPLKLFFFFSCELKQKGRKRKKAFVHRIEIVCFLSSWLGVGRGRQIAKSSLSVLLIPSSAEQSREERWMREGADSSVSRVSNPHAEEPGLWISSHH